MSLPALASQPLARRHSAQATAPLCCAYEPGSLGPTSGQRGPQARAGRDNEPMISHRARFWAAPGPLSAGGLGWGFWGRQLSLTSARGGARKTLSGRRDNGRPGAIDRAPGYAHRWPAAPGHGQKYERRRRVPLGGGRPASQLESQSGARACAHTATESNVTLDRKWSGPRPVAPIGSFSFKRSAGGALQLEAIPRNGPPINHVSGGPKSAKQSFLAERLSIPTERIPWWRRAGAPSASAKRWRAPRRPGKPLGVPLCLFKNQTPFVSH